MAEFPFLGEIGTALVAHPSAGMYGSDRVMLETVSALVAARWRVVVTTPVDGPALDEARRRGAETLVLEVPVLRARLPRPAALSRLVAQVPGRLAAADRLLRRLRPDVVYVSTTSIPVWTVAARLNRIPVVAHVHEAERSAARPLRAGLTVPLLLADRVVASSAFGRDVLRRDSRALARRTEVVYNGVGRHDVPLAPRERIEAPLRVAYVGRLSRDKGADVAIDAVALLRAEGIEVDLDVVGDAPERHSRYERDLRQRVIDRRVSTSVQFHGFREDAWRVVEDADVVVVPSREDEAFGNAAVDAVLAARPSVVSRSGGLPEAVEGFASALMVEPGDAEDLALAVRTILERWSRFRMDAVEDSGEAALRYAPELYRVRIAQVIGQAAGIGPQRRSAALVGAVAR